MNVRRGYLPEQGTHANKEFLFASVTCFMRLPRRIQRMLLVMTIPASCREAHKRRFLFNSWILHFAFAPLRMTISSLALIFTLAKKHYTPAEANQWLHDGNDNFVIITLKK